MLSRRILVRTCTSRARRQRPTPIRAVSTTYSDLHLKVTAKIVQNMPTPMERRKILERLRLDDHRRVLQLCVEQLNTDPSDPLTFRHHSKAALAFVAEQVRGRGYIVDDVEYGIKDLYIVVRDPHAV